MRPGIQSRLVSFLCSKKISSLLVFFRLQPGRRSDPNADAGNRELSPPTLSLPTCSNNLDPGLDDRRQDPPSVIYFTQLIALFVLFGLPLGSCSLRFLPNLGQGPISFSVAAGSL
ncbi:hypothetical protein GQ607_000269 [Colletotrichum asianum]|uniref:Uncharacterized protein n=1 Tax=Colletotrichum asianum TaxID=702518 RepID=A0A8H3WVL2_9PEZI|nr:hypothetical protein GQ607_000269 [Colletotrichum asianum]